MIGVIHVYTEEIKEMGELTSPNKREYCEKHGYKFIEVSQRKDLDLSVTIPDSKYMEPRMIPIGWSKIKLLKDTLENNKDIEWLFWIDADAVFMNYNKKLESFVNDKAFFYCWTRL